MKKCFEFWQSKSLYQSRVVRNLLTFLPIALLSVSLVWVGVVDAGPLPFQSSPPPEAPTATPPPPAPVATNAPETGDQPTAAPAGETPPKPVPTAQATQEPSRQKSQREESPASSSGSAIDWPLFADTTLATIGYIWLCCGGLALVGLPLILAAAYLVGRKRLVSPPGSSH